MQGMTKRELQVTDLNEIKAILDTAMVLRLGLAVNNEPYVVPMNYGYTMENGKLVLYLHSAVKGKKLDMLQANPNVFFELDCNPLRAKSPANMAWPTPPSWAGARQKLWRTWRKRSRPCPS